MATKNNGWLSENKIFMFFAAFMAVGGLLVAKLIAKAHGVSIDPPVQVAIVVIVFGLLLLGGLRRRRD